MAKDYYEILGISRSASSEELKKAYRTLAMKYHPDKNPGNSNAEKKIKELNEAYDILKDTQKRNAYDQMGHKAFSSDSNGNNGFTDIFEEMVSEFMGGGTRANTNEYQSKGTDLRYNLDITLEDAFKGMKKKINIIANSKCNICTGTGLAQGAKPETCNTCNGRGKVRTQQGFFTIERNCYTCHGMGQKISNPCKGCNGNGRIKKEKTILANIPAGIEDGSRIRLTGEGESGIRNGPSGDLYIFIQIKNHNFFERNGNDNYCTIPISMVTASLGGDIEVPTIEAGKARVKIPPGTQSGKKFRLRNKGMSILRSRNRGDMFIQVMVETPTKISKKQKDLLIEFSNLEKKSNSSPQSENFFTRMKELWNDMKDQ